MWMGKFLDLEENMDEFPLEIRNKILYTLKRKKLTPLEFTILEHVIKYPKGIPGYDLKGVLNKHFAGTWEAQSGTIYPLLSKLKYKGFLATKTVKSPIGPLKIVYTLTDIGKTIIKTKINSNFIEQIKFIGNFIVELLNIYIDTIPEEEKEENFKKMHELMDGLCNSIFKTLSPEESYKIICSNCNTEIHRRGAKYCFYCGSTIENN